MIVLGYRGELIRDWFESRWRGGAHFTWVENPDYHKSNGVSALKARNAIRDNFLLLMADHLFETETASMMVQQHLAHGEVILGVDPNIASVFDIDDATKVRRNGDRIVDIGKEIEGVRCDRYRACSYARPRYSTISTGASNDGNCSLSDGMRLLARGGRLRAMEIDAPWYDLDTPEALAHASRERLGYAA